MRIFYWAITAITVGLAAYLILVAGPYLTGQAGGLAPFDLRRSGYSPFEAKQFLDALSPDGAAFYLKVWWPLDTVFLLALALFSGLSIRYLYQGGAGMWGSAAKLVPAAYILFDFIMENRKVAEMIRGGAEALTEAEVLSAALMTEMKFVVFYLIVALLLGGVFYRYRAGKAVK
ncbi:MAG: hypothetical protein GXP03_01085 [Alphaproteobacteria bacterium]|nr:hypothetical protein [Alphaproteobacteria bacterium]